MEKSNYKLKYQKVKGKWVIFLLISGILSIFINKYLFIILCMISIFILIKYVKSDYNKSVMYYNSAIQLVLNGESKTAKKYLVNSIEYNRYNKEAYFFLGCIFFDEEDYTQALHYFKKGGVDALNDLSLAFVLGRCYYHIENYDKSKEYLESITYEKGSILEKERLFTLGKVYSEIEEYKKSYEILEKLNKPSGEIKGENLEYYYYLGVACYHIDKIDKAKEYLNMVCEVDSAYKNVDLYVQYL